jgi:hypothetical protein
MFHHLGRAQQKNHALKTYCVQQPMQKKSPACIDAQPSPAHRSSPHQRRVSSPHRRRVSSFPTSSRGCSSSAGGRGTISPSSHLRVDLVNWAWRSPFLGGFGHDICSSPLSEPTATPLLSSYRIDANPVMVRRPCDSPRADGPHSGGGDSSARPVRSRSFIMRLWPGNIASRMGGPSPPRGQRFGSRRETTLIWIPSLL